MHAHAQAIQRQKKKAYDLRMLKPNQSKFRICLSRMKKNFMPWK